MPLLDLVYIAEKCLGLPAQNEMNLVEQYLEDMNMEPLLGNTGD